jgi:Fur family iron response transcriptional regulator
MTNLSSYPEAEVMALLRKQGIQPTSQRVLVAQVLLQQAMHLSADELHRMVNAREVHQQVSKATVYNTLRLLTEKGIIREVIADPSRVFYDPNTKPHHHFYCVESGKLTDIDGTRVQVNGLPSLPPGTFLEGIDVIVRLRPASESK